MTFLSDAHQPEVDFFLLFGRDFEQILEQIVSLRIKTLSNIKRRKGSLQVNVCRWQSKTSLLN